MYPKVNQNIVVDIKSEGQMCRSIVAEVGEEEILIGFPQDRSIMGMLHVESEINITYFSDDSKYKFSSKILGRTNDNILLYRIKKPQKNEIERIQERENFRVNANLRLILNEKELNTVNISAGGLLFSCRLDLPLMEGEEISGTLHIPINPNKDLEQVSFQGKIKRISLTGDNLRNVALEFSAVHQRDQMKIMQYCFEKQKQNRLRER